MVFVVDVASNSFKEAKNVVLSGFQFKTQKAYLGCVLAKRFSTLSLVKLTRTHKDTYTHPYLSIFYVDKMMKKYKLIIYRDIII